MLLFQFVVHVLDQHKPWLHFPKAMVPRSTWVYDVFGKRSPDLYQYMLDEVSINSGAHFNPLYFPQTFKV